MPSNPTKTYEIKIKSHKSLLIPQTMNKPRFLTSGSTTSIVSSSLEFRDSSLSSRSGSSSLLSSSLGAVLNFPTKPENRYLHLEPDCKN